MNYDMFDIEHELNKIKLEFNKKSNKITELIKQNLNNKNIQHTFTYSIDKRTFVDSIEAILELHDWIDNCYDLGFNLDSCTVLSNLESILVDLLCKCCGDSMKDSDIAYFLYDLNGGKAFIPEDVINAHSPEELWNWLVDKKRGKFSND